MAVGSGTLLEEAIESWEFARMGVIAEADVFAVDEYDFRPAEGSRSVTELLRHLVESGLMMVGELTDPAGDFTRADPGTIYAEYAEAVPGEASPAGLRALLRTTLEEGVAKFREAGEVDMLQTIRRFDGESWTRLAWMHHGIAHEEYHRGQLALYARMCGHVPALTRMIHGDAAE
jgi:uncharacterized damage-inducible protein DinB